MQTNYDLDLQSYFTDMEHFRKVFADYVFASTLPKRLIVLHGVGGVGKSSLLRMFRLHCRNQNIPVALASGDEAKSTLDIITRWTDDLKEAGCKFPLLSKTLETYRAIQAKVDAEAKKTTGQIASKTASTVVSTLASMIPGIGPLVGPLGGLGAEAFTDWLHGFLTKSDIDLLLDPAKRLSDDFLEDIAKAAEKKRMVLLLDTFEQMSSQEDWVGKTAQKIHPNVLMVIAGRKLPDWNRFWPGWMMNTQVEELKPMTEEIMRQLIHRYYATMRGGEPASTQVDAIVQFARGLPMVVTSAVQLWVKYGVEDFQSVKAEIVANLVDRLMEGVPSSLIPVLEAAAVVRWFDQPILRAVLKQEDVREVYNELRRFPFARVRTEGLALHDSVREMMDENLRVQDSERYTELHENAALHFEKQLEKVTVEEAERLALERLYHRICANENIGTKLFQETAEKLYGLRLNGQLQFLVNDVQSYVRSKNYIGILVKFYVATFYRREHRYEEAARVYKEIGDNIDLDPKLRAYAYCNLGEIYTANQYLDKQGIEPVKKYIEQSLAFNLMDIRLAQNYFSLSRISLDVGNLEDARAYYAKARDFFKQSQDDYGELIVAIEAKDAGLNGHWKDYLSTHEDGLRILAKLPKSLIHFRGRFLRKWSRVWALAGRCLEGEKYIKEYLEIENRLQDNTASYSISYSMRDLGWTLGWQNKFDEAYKCFQESLRINNELGESFKKDRGRAIGFLGVILTRQGNFNEAQLKLDESLKFHQDFSYFPGAIYEAEIWLGLLFESTGELETAQQYYLNHRDWKWKGQVYSLCSAKTGLVRTKYALRDYASIPTLVADAEQFARQYEYNDHLSSLQLTQGHLAWEHRNQDDVLAFYKKAMIYALRYNRFLLDELLIGRQQGTPLRPIIPFCLEQGKMGQKILIALRDWWKSGGNDIGMPRPDSISPIPEGIPLLEAEKLAREREPGDGSIQKSIAEQFDAAI